MYIVQKDWEIYLTGGIHAIIYWSIPQAIFNSVSWKLLHLTCMAGNVGRIIYYTKEKRLAMPSENKWYTAKYICIITKHIVYQNKFFKVEWKKRNNQ